MATITFSSYLNLCGWAIPNQVVIVQLILLCAKMDCNCHYHLFNRSFVWNGHGHFKWLWQNQNIIHNSIEISLDLERMLSNLAEVYNQDHFVSFWYSFALPQASLIEIWSYKIYRKVASSSMSWLVAHLMIFRNLMKGKFDAYVVWPLAKKIQNWIVDRSTAWIIKKFIHPNHNNNFYLK